MQESQQHCNHADGKTAPLQLKYIQGEGLYLKQKDQWLPVRVKPCFPWSEPDCYLSLLDSDGTQVGFIENLSHIQGEPLQALRQGLKESNFCFEIQAIQEVTINLDLRQWHVETSSGFRIFHTKVSHWPTVLEDGQVFIKDLHGDNYRIVNPEQLDEKSQVLLSALADI